MFCTEKHQGELAMHDLIMTELKLKYMYTVTEWFCKEKERQGQLHLDWGCISLSNNITKVW